jgi:hypothetical protein
MDDITSHQTGSTAETLVHACFRGDLDAVSRLMHAGHDPDSPRELILDGIRTTTSPLLAAAAYGASPGGHNVARRAISTHIIRKLLEGGASVQAVDRSLIESLTISGNAEALQLVLRSGARLKQAYQLVALAISHHQVAILSTLKNFGIDPNVTDGHGNTALHHVCSGTLPFFRDSQWHLSENTDGWHLDRIRELVGAGVDLDRRDAIGATALMRAIVARQLVLANALVIIGADINCRMRNGVAALHLAVARANRSFVSVLLDQRIDRQDVLRIAMKRMQPDIRALIGTRIRSSENRKSARADGLQYGGRDRRESTADYSHAAAG